MTCSYYEWRSNFLGGDYYCLKKEAEVNDDVYKKYCRSYDYSDCPIYKGSSNSSDGCYLTTACMVAKGRDDKCYELETLRGFRDSYLKKSPEGNKMIEEYYSIAPKIVSEINKSDSKSEIYGSLYERVIAPCVLLIEEGRFKETEALYCRMVQALQKEFL